MLIGGFLIALFVGFLTGIFGVGGGFIMTPALIILLNVPATSAVGTDLAVILATSSMGIFKRRGSGTVDVKLALTIASGGIPGVLAGKVILIHLDKIQSIIVNGQQVVPLQLILLCLFLVLVSWIAWYLYFDYKKNNGQFLVYRTGLFSRFKIPPYGTYQTLDEPKLSVIVLILFGAMVGLLTGMMGIGGGVIMLPGLIYLIGQHAVKASGTSLMLVWIFSLAAVLLNGADGSIIYTLLSVMLAGGLTGTYFGTKVGLNIKGSSIRLYFILVVLVAILLIGAELVGMVIGTNKS